MGRNEPASSRAQFRGGGWIALLAVHLAAFIYGLSDNELVAATAVASAGALLATWYSVFRKSLLGMSPLLAFLYGHLLVFDIANYGYVQMSARLRGEYHELTAWMGAAIIWTALSSGIVADLVLGHEALPKRTGIVTAWQTLALSTGMFIGMAVLYVVTGTFNARYESVEPTGLIYFFYGIFPVIYMFFFLLGVSMRGSLVAPKNVGVVLFVLGIAFLQGLSGGREYSIMMCAFLLLGAAFGSIRRSALFGLGGFLVAASVAFLIMIGIARGGQFGKETLEGRARGVGNAAQEISAESEESQSPFALLLERLFEESAQVIIDQTVHTQHYAGFEGAEALMYMLVPRFLVPDKPTIDEGNVILERDFGYHLGETRIPLTLIGDAFRRGGAIWVFATGLFAGVAMRLLARIALLITGPEFGVMSLALCTTVCFRAYTESVFGLVSLFAYTCMKEIILVIIFAGLARVLVAVTEVSQRSNF